MKFFVTTTCVLLLASCILANPTATKDSNGGEQQQQNSAFGHCLETDSISCLQLTLFRKARAVFENPQIELFGGVSLVKANEGRQGKSLDENVRAVEAASSVESRNSEIGNYMMTNAKNFFVERSLNLNFASAARSLARAIPDDIKTDIRELVVESRTKKKKLIKKLLPILMGVGAKLAVLAVGAIIGLFILAKKALLVSVIAFVLALLAGASSGLSKMGGSSSFLGGLGGLFGGKSGGGGGASGWSSGGGGGGGWSSGGSGGSGWDSHGSYSSPIAQTIAYSGYKQARR